MKHLKKLTMTLVALFAMTAGAWADDYFYLVVDGTTATLKYGDKGENPYFKDGFVPVWKTSTDDNLDIKGFTTVTVDATCQNITSLPALFQNFTALTVINNLENINTTSITRMAGLFYGCSSLQTLDLSDWNTASVTTMMNMFRDCLSLETIYVGEGWSTEKVTISFNMFTGCTKLPNFDASIVDKTNAYAGGYLKAKPGTVLPTPNVNEWSLTMPAGNVELEILYKAQSQMALTFGGEDIDAEKGLTGYLNLEDEFAGSLGFAIEGLDAATGFTFESDNTAVMAFGENNEATGTLQDIKFLAVGEANLTIKFAGNDDYSRAEATVKVTVKEKDWTVTLNDGGVDTQNWTIDPATATTDGVKAGTEVKATYSGTKRVKSVKAVVTGAAPAAEAATIYSWESPNGTVSQTGGTIAYVNGDTGNGDRVNYHHIETNNYTICLNGKKNNITDGTASQNAGRMDVTLDEALAAGDVITITAYIYKNESKQSSAYIIFNGANGFDSSDMSVYAESAAYGDNENLYSSFNGSPKTVTVTVPAEAAGCKSFSMTRGLTGTNLFITKMTITRGVANN